MLWWTLGYTCLFQFWFPWYVCPAVGLLGHKAVLFAIFKGISTLFSIVAVLVIKRVPFSPHPLQHIACRLLDRSHSDWCEVVPHCGFDLHFSNNEWCWASFHVFVSHLCVLGWASGRPLFHPLPPELMYYLAVTMGLEFSGSRTRPQLFHLEIV